MKALRTIELKLLPCESGSYLTIQKQNGNIVTFDELTEATEFMKLWFNMKDYEITRYFEEGP